MAEICLHIIGAGRAASTLAAAWHAAGCMTVGQILNRSPASAGAAAALIGTGQPCTDMQQFCRKLMQHTRPQAQQWLLLGTPDSTIATVAESLRTSWRSCTSADLPLQLVFHLSGQLDASVLGEAAAWPGALHTAAAHPVVSFADPQRARQQLSDSYCVLDADRSSAMLTPLFARLGMHTLVAGADMDRARYHAALVLVSNYQCALQHMAEQLLQQAGFGQQQSRSLLGSLSSTVAANLADVGALESLTGPLERGDAAASARLLRACAGLDSNQQLATRALADVVLDMAADKGSLSAQQLQEMRALLNNGSSEPSS